MLPPRPLRAALLTIALALATLAAARAETITVTHWGGQFYGAPYAVAMDKGFFKARGVDVTGILTSAGGGTSVRNTLAGDLPFGEVSLAAAVQAINAGQPLKIIGAGVESVGDMLWIAKPGSTLHSVRDLVGHTVSFTSPGSVSNMVILMAMKAQGVDRSQVKLVPAGDVGANLAAVLNGAVEAGMTGEPLWSENQGRVQPVFWVKDVLPADMTQTVCVTTAEFAAAHPDTLRALIAGRREGVQFIRTHTDEAADITARAYHGDPALYRRVFANFLSINYWSEGKFNYPAMDRMVEGLQIVGQLKGPVEWGRMIDSSLLPPDLHAAR